MNALVPHRRACSQGGHVCLIAIFVGSSFLVALFVSDLGVVVNLIGAVSGAFLLIFVRQDPTTRPLSEAPSLHSFLHVSRFHRRPP